MSLLHSLWSVRVDFWYLQRPQCQTLNSAATLGHCCDVMSCHVICPASLRNVHFSGENQDRLLRRRVTFRSHSTLGDGGRLDLVEGLDQELVRGGLPRLSGHGHHERHDASEERQAVPVLLKHLAGGDRRRV